MKIDHTNVSSLKPDGPNRTQTQAAEAPVRPAGNPGEQPGRTTRTTDQIALSGLSQKLRALALESPEREQRIGELAAAYEARTYQPGAEETSRKLIDDTLAGS